MEMIKQRIHDSEDIKTRVQLLTIALGLLVSSEIFPDKIYSWYILFSKHIYYKLKQNIFN